MRKLVGLVGIVLVLMVVACCGEKSVSDLERKYSNALTEAGKTSALEALLQHDDDKGTFAFCHLLVEARYYEEHFFFGALMEAGTYRNLLLMSEWLVTGEKAWQKDVNKVLAGRQLNELSPEEQEKIEGINSKWERQFRRFRCRSTSVLGAPIDRIVDRNFDELLELIELRENNGEKSRALEFLKSKIQNI